MAFARTKIHPPRPTHAYVPRGGVDARLAEALASRRAVLVCAPAGYGKTSVLARALATLPAGNAIAWVSADEGDDLQRLLECLLAALEPFDPPSRPKRWCSAPANRSTRSAPWRPTSSTRSRASTWRAA